MAALVHCKDIGEVLELQEAIRNIRAEAEADSFTGLFQKPSGVWAYAQGLSYTDIQQQLGHEHE